MNDNHYVTDDEKANLLCDYFTAQCTLPPEEKGYDLPPLHIETDAILESIIITEAGVLKIIKGLNAHKACGYDGISNQLLKRCCYSIAHPLTLLFNKCMSEGIFPNRWKKANTTPVYKKDHPYYKTNYRPIS